MRLLSKITACFLLLLSVVFIYCQSAKQLTQTTAKSISTINALAPNGKKWNVLFIAVDDLNHWVSPLGRNNQVKTPNLDRLASWGTTFTQAHCAAPLCCPSRAALMSGLRPGTSGVYVNNDDWRKAIADSLTIFSHFKKNGYKVVGGGKLYHGGFDRDTEFDFYKRDAPNNANRNAFNKDQFGGIKWAQLDAGDDALNDYHNAQWAAEELSKKHDDKPIFIACGIFRPHMPWNVPKKYFEMYPIDKIQLPPYQKDDLDDLPIEGVKMADNGDHKALFKNTNSDSLWRAAIQAYQACITYADVQVGRILDAVEKSPERENTIIILWGDHGWHLGEKHHWRKFSLWEEATRAPFFMVVPNMTKGGSRCNRTVDFMSIYPTLADLCGLPIPKHTEGYSIKSLLQNPNAAWDKPAITTFGLNNHSIRTEKWRYIRYAKGGEELYDEIADPYEWKNLANDKKYDAVKKELAAFLPKVNKPEGLWKGQGGVD
jgi:arylsulfatase A-like enzyme